MYTILVLLSLFSFIESRSITSNVRIIGIDIRQFGLHYSNFFTNITCMSNDGIQFQIDSITIEYVKYYNLFTIVTDYFRLESEEDNIISMDIINSKFQIDPNTIYIDDRPSIYDQLHDDILIQISDYFHNTNIKKIIFNQLDDGLDDELKEFIQLKNNKKESGLLINSVKLSKLKLPEYINQYYI